MNEHVFIEEVANYAIFYYSQYPILPSVTVAQAILESNWGTSTLATKANALFGIKASVGWYGNTYTIDTWEIINGKKVNVKADFRAYASWKESVKNHGAFLCGLSRYSNIVGEKDYTTVCRLLYKDGYATDTAYADKLINIIEKYGLQAFDLCCTLPLNPPPMPEPEEDVNRVIYIIQHGDTLSKIAIIHGMSVNALMEINNIDNPDKIYAGEVIYLN